VITISHVKLRSLMRSLSVADERSGLLNRNAYVDYLLAECNRALTQRTPMTVLLVRFGDESTLRELGPDAVNHFVREAGQAIAGHLRQNDVAFRYDQSTLALLMPDTKGKDGFFVVEKIRRLVGSVKSGQQDLFPVTAGMAGAVLQGQIDAVDSVTELINRVEAALESALRDGGNTSRLLSAAPEPQPV
jgi:diguanylate cyclase (GGDEF)-like protein